MRLLYEIAYNIAIICPKDIPPTEAEATERRNAAMFIMNQIMRVMPENVEYHNFEGLDS